MLKLLFNDEIQECKMKKLMIVLFLFSVVFVIVGCNDVDVKFEVKELVICYGLIGLDFFIFCVFEVFVISIIVFFSGVVFGVSNLDVFKGSMEVYGDMEI